MWIILIPASSLIAFLAIAAGGRWLGELSHRVGIVAVTISFALSFLGTILVITSGPIALPLYTLIQSGPLTVEIGLYADGFAMSLVLLVSGVSAVVHVFSSRYMQGEPRYARFFAVMALFTSTMLLLVLSANLLMLYICWEVMGLCSYLLISHWAERRSACQAATRAFLVNAVTDLWLGLGVILTWSTFDTLDIQTILSQAPEIAPRTVNLLSIVGLEWSVPVLFVIASLLFAGVVGKSAQFPLHVWLPFAMEAPTPVSALIHAATMVNAGVYLLVRLGPLYVLSPGAMMLVALTGAFTALFAGIVGLTQCDIKRILAYSTISQLGFMVMACGVGAFRAATFHLVSHGVLKAYLFLSAGSAISAIMPPTSHRPAAARPESSNNSWFFYGGSFLFAILPAVLLFSAPYAALWTSTEEPRPAALYSILGLTTSFFAAYYLSLLVLETFRKPIPLIWQQVWPASLGRPRLFSASLILGLIPLVAGLAVFLAFFWTAFTRILVPAGMQALPSSSTLPESVFDLEPFVVPFLVATAGWGVALVVCTRTVAAPAWVEAGRRGLYVFLMNCGYVDEIYEVFVVRPMLRAARWVWSSFDVRLIDGMYRAMAMFSLALSRWLWQVIDVRGIDRAVTAFGTSSFTAARWLWTLDVRGVERIAEEVGHQSDATGQRLARLEPQTLQRHILVIIAYLVAGLALLYSFAGQHP